MLSNRIMMASGAIGGNDAFTVLLLHCDGADASTTVTDSSGSAHTITVNADAQIDTAQSKFGGASLLLDGTGDYITAPASADWQVGSGDFTVDLWVRPTSDANSGIVIRTNDTTASFTSFAIRHSTTSFKFYSSSNGSSWDVANAVSMGTASTATWTHLAVARDGSSIRLFRNGVLIDTITSSATLFDEDSVLSIGGNSGASDLFTGHVDEVRVSKGIARWTAAFTPPAAPYS